MSLGTVAFDTIGQLFSGCVHRPLRGGPGWRDRPGASGRCGVGLWGAIGVAMLWYNLWLMLLPFVFWWLMGFMMRHTEEKWLRRLYGAEYDAYCRRVNRTWPWFPKK